MKLIITFIGNGWFLCKLICWRIWMWDKRAISKPRLSSFPSEQNQTSQVIYEQTHCEIAVMRNCKINMKSELYNLAVAQFYCWGRLLTEKGVVRVNYYSIWDDKNIPVLSVPSTPSSEKQNPRQIYAQISASFIKLAICVIYCTIC